MSRTLLTTKLYIPRVRSETVPRPRLLERLQAGMALGPAGFVRKLTLISAPAGFGKTTLLSACIPLLSFPVAWVSLDSDDNEPGRFWRYVIAALQKTGVPVSESVLDLIQPSQPPEPETMLAGLINELTEAAQPRALVLDDLHQVTEGQVHAGITFLVENLPPHLHLVLASRADPPWPLARLRARGELNELRVQDLRFTREEAAAFLNEAMGLDLSPEAIAALDARIEGWIAGLQMAALSIRGRMQTQDPQALASFINSLSGSHRFILDYLVEEVLEHQPPGIQDFLFKTSLLEQLSAPLCDALLGAGRAAGVLESGPQPQDARPQRPGSSPAAHALVSSQQILDHLEAANLFLIPLDDERHWYRYHRLFADLLLSRLKQRTGAQGLADLHLRASRWYEDNGMIAKAVGHALAADDFQRVAWLVEANALPLIYHVELLPVLRWLDNLPADVLRSRPWLPVALAWALVYAGQMEAVEARLKLAEEALGQRRDAALEVVSEKEETERMVGHMAAIRGYALAIEGDNAQSAALSRQALAHLPAHDVRARSFAVGTVGFALSSSGDLEGAERAYSEALALCRAAHDRHLNVVMLTQMANVKIAQGQLHEAAAFCREALQLAEAETRETGEWMPVAGYAHAHMSWVHREWNDLEAATHHAQLSVDLCRRWGQKTIEPTCYRMLAAALEARGDYEGALDAIRHAKQTAASMSPWLHQQMEACEAGIRLARGDMANAWKWAESQAQAEDSREDLSALMPKRILARVLLARGAHKQALEILARTRASAEELGLTGEVIQNLTLQALGFHAQGQQDQALEALSLALSLAEPGGYVRTFVGEGAPMAQLLQQLAPRATIHKYVSRLLKTFGAREFAPLQVAAAEGAAGQPLSARRGVQPLIEPLTEREMEVLRLLTTRLSIPEIADQLVVAVSTVRSHTKSIYGKLGAHSRMEAVRRAEEVGLL